MYLDVILFIITVIQSLCRIRPRQRRLLNFVASLFVGTGETCTHLCHLRNDGRPPGSEGEIIQDSQDSHIGAILGITSPRWQSQNPPIDYVIRIIAVVLCRYLVLGY